MRLIAAYVAGFGKLTDIRIDYEKGFTALCMENGWGKTTLAYFHKAMFYGLDSTGKQKGDIKERERYKPWTSAPFGGWLEFAVDTPEGEKFYRIERAFGDKPAKDSFSLLSLPGLRPSADYSESIGMELFGLNAGSFIRTVFCTGSLRTPPQTPDSGLLAEHMGENPADTKTLEAAIAKLETRRVELQPKKGDGGRISALRREIFALDQQIHDCIQSAAQAEEHRTNLARIGGQIEEYKAESDRIRAEIDIFNRKRAEAILIEQYRGLLARANERRREKSGKEAFFQNGFSSEEDLLLLQRQADECRLAAEYARQAARPFDREKDYEESSARFQSGLPDEDSLRDYREIEEKLAFGRRREQEIRGSAEFLRVSDRFAGRIPEEETVDQMIGLSQASRSVSARRSPRKVPLILGGVLLLIALLGLLLPIGNLRFAVVGLFCAAAVLLIVFSLTGQKITETDSTLTDFLADFEIAQDDALSGLHKLRADLSLYRSECEKLTALSKDNGALSASLAEFLDYYQVPDTKTLEIHVNRAIELDQARKAHIQAAETARMKAEEASAALTGLLSRYPMVQSTMDPTDPESAIAQIRGAKGALDLLTRALADAQREAEQFAKQHPSVLAAASAAPTDASDPTDATTPEELRAREAELAARLDERKDAYRMEENALDTWTREADRLPLLQEERLRKTEQWEQATAALTAIEQAETLLKQASQNLSDRYLTGVQDRFAAYLRKLTDDKTEAERYHMDGSLAVLSEEAGKQRTSGLLSAGKQDLAALCARLALTDTLMDGKADFLILDDPFTNLDDGRVESALALLGGFAGDRQILYLTCSRSRMPKQRTEE